MEACFQFKKILNFNKLKLGSIYISQVKDSPFLPCFQCYPLTFNELSYSFVALNYFLLPLFKCF